jgi:hypothetical protein
MTTSETIDKFLADVDRDSLNRANYFWREVYESSLLETKPSKKLERMAFAETLLYGRRQQLQELAVDVDAEDEWEELQVAIERLRSVW